MQKYLSSAYLSFTEKTNGGILYLLPEVLIKICTLIPLMYLWRSVMLSGAETGMTMPQMLTYTYVSALLSEMLVVETRASGWLSEGVIMRLYGRPLTVVGQLMAQTAGGWLPMLLLFSLPMTALAPLFGINLIPASPMFFISLVLCVSLGFAVDLLFACLSIRLRNMSWLVSRIRMALATLLSGTIIPMRILPFGIGEILKYQPFASLGGAPLSIFTGAAGIWETLLVQTGWNLILWPMALLVFKKSQERMVSYGG